MEDKIRETGRKACIRLEEEKKKKKEIVRLDDDDLKAQSIPGSSNKRARSTFSESVKSSSQKSRKITKIKSATTAKRRKINRLSKERKPSSADLWTPRLEGLSCYNLPPEQRSNVVRLHGLPLGVKFDHIRKFFTGLSPEHIFTLPSLNGHIHDFDAFEESGGDRMSGRDPFVERYPNYFRAYVKFKSHPIAAVAIGRAGETIRVEDKGNGVNVFGAAIGITPVSKTIASHLLKYMAIDSIKGKNLEETTSEVENSIPQIVNEILWVMARRKLALNVEISRIGGGKFDTISVRNLDVALVPSSTTDRRKIALLYNQLWDMHEKLLSECMPTQLHEFDLSVVNLEPGQRHVSVAGHWLLDEMDMINQCLAHCRHSLWKATGSR